MKTFALNKRKTLLIVTFLCSILFGFSQTTLSAGDIVITGFLSDAPDKFTFVLLTDVQATTEIKFTDNGWQSSGSFRPGEGVLVWTADTDLPCGTEVVLQEGLSTPYVASPGTVVDDPSFNLAQNGDHILAYQGSEVTPTFLYAVHFASGVGWSNATTAQTTALPTGLTDGVNAVYIGDFDNGNYDCSVTVDPALILSAVSTSSNWITSNYSINLGGCIYGCYSCATTTTWNGTNWDNGFPDITTEVIIDDLYDTDLHSPGSFDACSLTVTGNGVLRVSDGDYILVENDIKTDGTFIVNEEGTVVQLDDNANVIGAATVRKRTAPMSNYYEYTYWSSPVSGETIAGGLADSDPTRRFSFEAGNFKDSFTENSNDNNLVPGHDDIDDDGDDWQFTPATTEMLPGVGYASHHEESIFFLPPMQTSVQFTYTFDGPFNNGVITVPVLRNETAPVETADMNWNFIGNPYPSAINVDSFFTENNYDLSTNPNGTLTGAIYLWSQNSLPAGTNNGNENYNFANSDYAIINGIGATGTATQGGDPIIPNRFIPSGQGFFVAYSDLVGTASGNVIFNNSMRVTGNNDQFFRLNEFEENKFYLNLTSENGIFNQMLVGYAQGATNQKDEMYYDAPRNLSSGASAIIYSVIEDSSRKFAIQGRDINSLNINDIIPIGIKSTIDSDTQLKISLGQLMGEFLNNNDIYIHDNLLNVDHNLSNSGYTFTLDAGEYNSRFEIFFSGTLSINDLNLGSEELVISNSGENNIEISTKGHSQISNVKIYDLLGRELFDVEGNNNSLVNFNTSSLSNSVFILNVTTADRKKLTKKFLNN